MINSVKNAKNILAKLKILAQIKSHLSFYFF